MLVAYRVGVWVLKACIVCGSSNACRVCGCRRLVGCGCRRLVGCGCRRLIGCVGVEGL